MSEEILVNVTPQETRVAVVENGVLQEVIIERANRRGLVGNIYHGKVCRVLPGMQAAFVDIGLERAAFLHASDITANDDEEKAVGEVRVVEPITQLLHEGKKISVQVIKDPLGSKGARLTTHITIPSRYLVFMPGASNVGVSQKIEDEQERQRLKDIVSSLRTEGEQGGISCVPLPRVWMRNPWRRICCSCANSGLPFKSGPRMWCREMSSTKTCR